MFDHHHLEHKNASIEDVVEHMRVHMILKESIDASTKLFNFFKKFKHIFLIFHVDFYVFAVAKSLTQIHSWIHHV